MAKKQAKSEMVSEKEGRSTPSTSKTKAAARTIPPVALKDKAFELIFDSIDQDEVVRIEAMVKGYNSPDKITFGGYNAKSHQPDALAYYEESTDIYSIEPEANKKAIARNLGKWILFSLEAKKNKGNYFIVTSPNNYNNLHDIISAKQINAEIMTVETV